ncbi:MAG: response regulator [Actinomycetota bacterium]
MDHIEGSDRAGIRRVLYVDDNPINLKLVGAIFSSRPDIELVTAATAGTALAAALEAPPDLVLLDLNLPDRPGDEVVEELSRDPRTSAVPVVIVSAEDDGHVRSRARAAGADAYLTKPFDLDSFLGVVDRFLE